ncbi:MAG: GNAT family N-acetyltransferase, partial [Cryomorphaceae bacterium]|nr:GNAT family N-acetyltransferase [Cryomorphaceae bacterium]
AIYHEKQKTGHFGFFDCIDDSEVAELLLNHAANYLREFGVQTCTGPLNPGINYELGVLVSGFEHAPFFMMNYNPPYYNNLLESSGASAEMTFFAYELPCGIRDEKIRRVSEQLKKRYTVGIREIDFQNYDQEARVLCGIYNDAFSHHWGFTPFEEDEFLHLARSLKQILNKRLIFQLTLHDKPIGFILAIPNLNEAVQHLPNGKITIRGLWKFLKVKRTIQWVKVMVAAVEKQYQHLGFGSLLYVEMARRVAEEGYLGGEISWVAENNVPMNGIVVEMGGKKTKTYKVYRYGREL